MDFGNPFDCFLELLTVIRKFLNFLKIYSIKFEIKSSIETTSCDNGACRSGDSYFLPDKCYHLEKIEYLKFYSFHLFLVEKQQQYNRFIQYQTHTSSFSWASGGFFIWT